MARETGVYRRGDSRRWWIATTLPNGRRIRQSSGTEDRKEAEALLAKIKVEAFRGSAFRDQAPAHVAGGRSPVPLRQAASSEYRLVQADLQALDEYLGELTLNQINGDVIWTHHPGPVEARQQPATINRLSLHGAQPVAHRA